MINRKHTGQGLELCIERPERRNALTHDMYAAMAAALHEAQDDPACRYVILSGTQGHFTAGNDLAEFRDFRPGGESAGMDFLHALVDVDVPVIAAVEGQAVGVGTTLLQHCDYVYAGRGAQFRMPFVALGLCPEGGSSLALARLVGARRAARWLLSAQPFGAQEAADSGFITAVTDDGAALDAAREQAALLAALPAAAVRTSKRLMRAADRPALHAAIDAEWTQFGQRLLSEEAQQAFRQFFEKR